MPLDPIARPRMSTPSLSDEGRDARVRNELKPAAKGGLLHKLGVIGEQLDLNGDGEASWMAAKVARALDGANTDAHGLMRAIAEERDLNALRLAEGKAPVDLVGPSLRSLSNDQLGQLLVSLRAAHPFRAQTFDLRDTAAYKVITAKVDPALRAAVETGTPFTLPPEKAGLTRGAIDGVLQYVREDTEKPVRKLESLQGLVQKLRDADPLRPNDGRALENYLRAAGYTQTVAELDQAWIRGNEHLDALTRLPQHLGPKSLWINTYFSFAGDAAKQYFDALEQGVQDSQKPLGLAQPDPAQPHARAVLFYDEQGSSAMDAAFRKRIHSSPWVQVVGLKPHEYQRISGQRTNAQLYEHSKFTAVRLDEPRYNGSDAVFDWGSGNLNDEEVNADPSVEWKNINGRTRGELALEGVRTALQLAENHGVPFTEDEKRWYLRPLESQPKGDTLAFLAKHNGNRDAIGQLTYKALLDTAQEMWLFSPYNTQQGVFAHAKAAATRAEDPAQVHVVFADKDNQALSKIAAESLYQSLRQGGVDALADGGGGMEHTKGALMKLKDGTLYLLVTSHNNDEVSHNDGETLVVLKVPEQTAQGVGGSAETFVQAFTEYLAKVAKDARPVGTTAASPLVRLLGPALRSWT